MAIVKNHKDDMLVKDINGTYSILFGTRLEGIEIYAEHSSQYASEKEANYDFNIIVGEQKEKDLSIIQSNPMKLRDGGRQR